jgi:hypothetical protein
LIARQGSRHGALLAVIERPNLVALDPFRFPVADQLIVHLGAGRPGVDQALATVLK